MTGITEKLQNCMLCPRKCKINRLSGEKGFCGGLDTVRVARAALHFWEEPCISGTNGSGTVFFCGCTMNCIYCQNKEISRGIAGKEITTERLCEIFLELMEKGANNINLVTPMHYMPQIITALSSAKQKGLNIPIVWNIGGWELEESVKTVKDYADIWLTDFKYYDDKLALDYSKAPNYFETASKALAVMTDNIKKPIFDEDGIMKKGVIVRHLILPGHTDDSKKVLKYLYETYHNNIWISIMNQYTPVIKSDKYPNLLRKVSDEEYEDVIDYAISLGIENAFIQEGETQSESFIPPFDLDGV